MRPALRWIIFFIALPIAVYLYLTLGRVDLLKKGDLPPDFILSDLDGNAFKLSEQLGRVVVVHFWATWCDLCVEEFPSLVNMGDALKGENVLILAVNEDGRKWSPGRYKSVETDQFNILLDKDGVVADTYGVYTVPQTLIIGKDGRIVDNISGIDDFDSLDSIQRMRALIEK